MSRRGANARLLMLLCCGAFGLGTKGARADEAEAEPWSLHAQLTNVTQFQPDFRSPYVGTNSLQPGTQIKETVDLTLYAGLRVWQGGELWLNPELDQGFGLSDTLGVAGFPSGEAYKVGSNPPYFRLPRAYFRQVIELGGERETVDSAPNQLGKSQSSDRLTLTFGKFSAVDLFDTNRYAHDPRADFLNWGVIESGAFDYAADAWGYTYGMAAEWQKSWWTLRLGAFDMSEEPNSKELDESFSNVALMGELEARHELFGRPGAVKLLGFLNRAEMAKYRDAIALGEATDTAPNPARVRKRQARGGLALNVEQELAADLGAFLRLSTNDGRFEAFDFTDVNRSVSTGVSIGGQRWSRPDDTFGLAVVVNGISRDARDYFAAGGLGILIGDGQLPRYGVETIAETYYSLRIAKWLSVAVDYQFISNPAYNRDRGPVSVVGLRIHMEM